MANTTKSPFDKYDLKKAKELISAEVDKGAVESRLFFRGDHWQKGLGWIGPAPQGESAERNAILATIEPVFVSKNAIAEIVNRHADSLLSRVDSCWYLIPKEEEAGLRDNRTQRQATVTKLRTKPVTPPRGQQPEKISDLAKGGEEEKGVDPRVAEIMDPLNSWWTEKEAVKNIRRAVENFLVEGRGGLRLFVPQGKIENNTIPNVDFISALEYIHIDAPSPDNAAIITDNLTMEKVYLHVWTEKNLTDDKEYEYSEIVFVDRSGGTEKPLTIIKFESDDPGAPKIQVTIDLNKRSIFFEMKRDRAMVTPQVKSLQKLINMALTMMSRNVVQAGFLERVIINAELPGQMVVDPTVPGGKRFQPARIELGSGYTTSLRGIVTEDDEGKKTLAEPNVLYRDPVSVETFSATKQEAYNAILEDTEQTHMMIAGDAFASGESRIQARANFAASVVKTRGELEPLIKWLVETTIQLASTFSGSPDQYSDLRAVVAIKPDTGPMTPEERKVVMEQYTRGLMSRETCMVLLGVDNPDEEILKVESETKITTPLEKAQIITALSKTGWMLAMEHLPEVDEDIIGIQPRNIDEYKKELEEKAERESKSGANAGAAGGSPKGSTNKPGTQDPGPTGGSGE